jgi:hypothetical protein
MKQTSIPLAMKNVESSSRRATLAGAVPMQRSGIGSPTNRKVRREASGAVAARLRCHAAVEQKTKNYVEVKTKK